jgi:hypothetical protein
MWVFRVKYTPKIHGGTKKNRPKAGLFHVLYQTDPLGESSGMNLSDYQPFGAFAKAHHQHIALLHFFETVATQGFNMDEYVRRIIAAHNKAIAFGAVEPFNRRRFEVADRGFDGRRRMLPHRRAVAVIDAWLYDRLAILKGFDVNNLPAFDALGDFTGNASVFRGNFPTDVPKTRYMQKDVTLSGKTGVFGHNEPVTLAGVEPFYAPIDTVNDFPIVVFIIVKYAHYILTAPTNCFHVTDD